MATEDSSGLWSGFGEAELHLTLTYATSVLAFALVYGLLVAGISSEIRLIKRYLAWLRVIIFLLAAAFIVLLVFDIREGSAIEWPLYGVARPIAGLLLLLPALNSGTHACFRWLTFLAPMLFVVLDSLGYVIVHAIVECRADGTCESTEGFTLFEVQVLAWRALAAIFLEVQLLLVVAAAGLSIGICSPRYPVRLFSSSNPVSEVPAALGGHSYHALETTKIV